MEENRTEMIILLTVGGFLLQRTFSLNKNKIIIISSNISAHVTYFTKL